MDKKRATNYDDSSVPPTSVKYVYPIIDEGGSGYVHIFFREGINGTANAASRTYNLPFYAPMPTSIALLSPYDNGAVQAAGLITISANSLNGVKSGFIAWTASGDSRLADWNGRYKIV